MRVSTDRERTRKYFLKTKMDMCEYWTWSELCKSIWSYKGI